MLSQTRYCFYCNQILTPITYRAAALKGHVGAVETLIEHQADVEKKMKSGASPLFISAQNGHTTALMTLLVSRD